MQVYLTRSAQKDLDHLPNKVALKIGLEIQKLARDPFPINSKKLQFRNSTYRIRVGDYRAIYELDTKNSQIGVVKIRHRKDVYK